MRRLINAVVVDDEQRSIDNICIFLRQYSPAIQVVGTATDLESARVLLSTTTADVAFLDVQLYQNTIFELLETMVTPDLLKVFVTAYDSYALKAIKQTAFDYLLKPIESSEFISCTGRIIDTMEQRERTQLQQAPARVPRVMLRQGESIYAVAESEVLYLRASGFYTAVIFEQQGQRREIIAGKPINVVQAEWESENLQRIHRSYVVNMNRVRSVQRDAAGTTLIMSDNFAIPVAKRRTADFFQIFRQRKDAS
jgi:two-component system LytT family response regulator